jgi:hypothetical protein
MADTAGEKHRTTANLINTSPARATLTKVKAPLGEVRYAANGNPLAVRFRWPGNRGAAAHSRSAS